MSLKGEYKGGVTVSAILEIRDYSKTYKGGKRAVDHLSLSIESGDIFGFIGHNGAGKTTTLKAVAGILDFEEGEILIDGLSIRQNPVEAKKNLAFLPDNPDLYEFLTGVQFLNFTGDVYGVSREDKMALIDRYSGIFEMKDHLGNLISSYSHGMKQKLALISALIHSPKLLVLDEPFVGLDPKAAMDLKTIMKDLCNQGGAIFFSTHVLEVAQKLCNKIAIIKQGRLVACGDTEEMTRNSDLEEVFMEVTGDER